MIPAIFFYFSWLFVVFGLWFLSVVLSRVWWSLWALSRLEEYEYTTISCTPFETLVTIKPLCERHDISYLVIYFGRLVGRILDRIG